MRGLNQTLEGRVKTTSQYNVNACSSLDLQLMIDYWLRDGSEILSVRNNDINIF